MTKTVAYFRKAKRAGQVGAGASRKYVKITSKLRAEA